MNWFKKIVDWNNANYLYIFNSLLVLLIVVVSIPKIVFLIWILCPLIILSIIIKILTHLQISVMTLLKSKLSVWKIIFYYIMGAIGIICLFTCIFGIIKGFDNNALNTAGNWETIHYSTESFFYRDSPYIVNGYLITIFTLLEYFTTTIFNVVILGIAISNWSKHK